MVALTLCSCNEEKHEWMEHEPFNLEISGLTFEQTSSPLYLKASAPAEGASVRVTVADSPMDFGLYGGITYSDKSLSDLNTTFRLEPGKGYDSDWCAIQYTQTTPPYEMEITIPANHVSERTIEVTLSAPYRMTDLKIYQPAISD